MGNAEDMRACSAMLDEIADGMLALHWYDNRGAIGTASTDNRELPYGVMTIMHQLRY